MMKNLPSFRMIPPEHHEERHIRERTEMEKMYEHIKDAPEEGA
jgi:hypothetical protein